VYLRGGLFDGGDLMLDGYDIMRITFEIENKDRFSVLERCSTGIDDVPWKFQELSREEIDLYFDSFFKRACEETKRMYIKKYPRIDK
jgi:hypothetical protein